MFRKHRQDLDLNKNPIFDGVLKFKSFIGLLNSSVEK